VFNGLREQQRTVLVEASMLSGIDIPRRRFAVELWRMLILT
jgi:hypothetical protein